MAIENKNNMKKEKEYLIFSEFSFFSRHK
ncbi:hypothetical protein EMIT074MI3_10230 [Bacillus licheniformis]